MVHIPRRSTVATRAATESPQSNIDTHLQDAKPISVFTSKYMIVGVTFPATAVFLQCNHSLVRDTLLLVNAIGPLIDFT